MRAIWKGAVSFGLVSVPVKVYAATENHDISFRQVHAEDGGRIKYQRVCSLDGEEVAYADIAKGYETDDGQMVVLTDEDFAQLPASSSREITVEKFVPREQIDPMLLERSYYLEPDKAAAKPYALLREALEEADRVAVVTVSLRTRMTTAILRVRGDVIVMQTMMWPDEIRNPDFAGLGGTEQAATEQELKMARLLVDTLAGDYDPSEFEDDYRNALEALVQTKLEGGEVKTPPQPEQEAGEVVDLLAALQRSVDAARGSHGETPEESAEAEPAKKSSPRKSTAKKAAPKKSASEKSASEKSASEKSASAKSAPEKSTAKKSTKKTASKKKEPARRRRAS